MAAVCKEWSYPDGNHFSGLCTNELMPKTGASTVETPKDCEICVIPILVPVSGS